MTTDAQQATTVPRALVEGLVATMAALRAEEDRQRATQALMIRGCVQRLRAPRPSTTFGRNQAVKDDAQQRELALLHLDWLATQLENQSVRSSDNKSNEGTAPCTQASDTPPAPAATATPSGC